MLEMHSADVDKQELLVQKNTLMEPQKVDAEHYPLEH